VDAEESNDTTLQYTLRRVVGHHEHYQLKKQCSHAFFFPQQDQKKNVVQVHGWG